MSVHPEQDRYSRQEIVFYCSGNVTNVRCSGPNHEPMEWESDREESQRVSQEQEHKKEEAEQVNAGLPVGKLLPASNFQISRNVCIDPMEFEEGNVVPGNSEDMKNPLVHPKSVKTETGVINPIPVHTPSENIPIIHVSKNGCIEPMECETDKENSFKEGEVVLGNTGAMKNLLMHLKSVQTETGVINPWLISEKEFHYAEEIGRGANGIVFPVNVMGTRKFVSKKVNETNFIKTEVDILLNLKHASIPTLFGLIKRPNVIEILMQFSGINLEQFVQTEQSLDDCKIWSIAKQLLDALDFLNKRGIMHMDLHQTNQPGKLKHVWKHSQVV